MEPVDDRKELFDSERRYSDEEDWLPNDPDFGWPEVEEEEE